VSEELELSPNSKYISEIYTDESELEMLKMDLVIKKLISLELGKGR
jgi:hypothetical protein